MAKISIQSIQYFSRNAKLKSGHLEVPLDQFMSMKLYNTLNDFVKQQSHFHGTCTSNLDINRFIQNTVKSLIFAK